MPSTEKAVDEVPSQTSPTAPTVTGRTTSMLKSIDSIRTQGDGSLVLTNDTKCGTQGDGSLELTNGTKHDIIISR